MADTGVGQRRPSIVSEGLVARKIPARLTAYHGVAPSDAMILAGVYPGRKGSRNGRDKKRAKKRLSDATLP